MAFLFEEFLSDKREHKCDDKFGVFGQSGVRSARVRACPKGINLIYFSSPPRGLFAALDFLDA